MKRLSAALPLVLVLSLLPAALSVTAPLAAQDFGFGFGGGDAEAEGSGAFAVPVLSVNGEAGAALRGFIGGFAEGAGSVRLGDVFSGKLNLSADTSFVSAFINLKLSPSLSPVAIGEAYVRAYFGDFTVEGGLRKLSWGKADSMGPLDVINPLDYSDLTLLVDSLSDGMAQTIARPMVHAGVNLGRVSKLEGVFVPNFEPARFAASGRWAPARMAALTGQITEQIVGITNSSQKQYTAGVLSQMLPGIIANAYPETSTLDYAQAGLRFTTTVGSADLGAQYYYGRLPTPAVSMAKSLASIAGTAVRLAFAATPAAGDTARALLAPPEVGYNPYHQIGLDYAQVIAGFNVRAELAANLTGDWAGNDGAVYNPHLAWSLGFDRDILWGVNLNLQASETITLRHGKIGSNPLLDIEAESGVTSTRITAKLSRTFLQDRLEISAAAVWGIEDSDCLVMPVINWTQNDITVGLSGGFFAGDRDGQFGQYRDNSFIQVRMKYRF
jgi:hypothetical protein